MATAVKHKERSHRSYKEVKPFRDFERKSQVAKYRKEQRKSILSTLLHRTTNK